MKILLMGDASNCHATLARGLAALGHNVTVASHGSRWMDTERAIDLSRRPGKLGGMLFYVKLSSLLRNDLRGYDVVQLVNPIFVDLRPARVRSIYARLRKNNGSVFLSALGNDTAYIDACTDPEGPLQYSEWAVNGIPTPFRNSPRGKQLLRWLQPELADHCRYIYNNVNGIVSILYEYHLAMGHYIESDRLAYGGLPIDTLSIPRISLPTPGERITAQLPFHTGREGEKGIDLLSKAATAARNLRVEPVTGLKYADFVQKLSLADVVLDQIYAYSPGTTALLAMAMGKTVVTGGEQAYADFIGDWVPVINGRPDNLDALTAALERLTPETMTDMGRRAQAFVEKHHSAAMVAQRYVDFWIKRYDR